MKKQISLDKIFTSKRKAEVYDPFSSYVEINKPQERKVKMQSDMIDEEPRIKIDLSKIVKSYSTSPRDPAPQGADFTSQIILVSKNQNINPPVRHPSSSNLDDESCISTSEDAEEKEDTLEI